MNSDRLVDEADDVASSGGGVISVGGAVVVVVGRFFFDADEMIDEFEFPSSVDIDFSVAVSAVVDNGDRLVDEADCGASGGDVIISVGGAAVVVVGRFFFDADEMIDEFEEVIAFRLFNDTPIFRFLGGIAWLLV